MFNIFYRHLFACPMKWNNIQIFYFNGVNVANHWHVAGRGICHLWLPCWMLRSIFNNYALWSDNFFHGCVWWNIDKISSIMGVLIMTALYDLISNVAWCIVVNLHHLEILYKYLLLLRWIRQNIFSTQNTYSPSVRGEYVYFASKNIWRIHLNKSIYLFYYFVNKYKLHMFM